MRQDEVKQRIRKRAESIEKNYLVPNGITHLMMWFGNQLPSSQIVEQTTREPKNTYATKKVGIRKDPFCGTRHHQCVDYVKTLQEECKKMQKNGDNCILVYNSVMLYDYEKQQLKNIVKDIPNCYLVDYNEFVKKIQDITLPSVKSCKYPIATQKLSNFCGHISDLIYDLEHDRGGIGHNSIQNIVDCSRMLLLLCPGYLKEMANISNSEKKKLNTKDYSLLYQDFDCIYKDNETNCVNSCLCCFCCKKQYDPIDINTINDIKNESLLMSAITNDKGRGRFLASGGNDIIFANSPHNRNQKIENYIYRYLNDRHTGINEIMYLECDRNDFSSQFIHENHNSYNFNRTALEIKLQPLYSDFHINNNKRALYELNECTSPLVKSSSSKET